jgi:hypothetical protein
MQVAFAIEQIESKYRSLASVLEERARRHWAATEARAYGWGGVSAVSEATGMSANTIRKGLADLVAREGGPDSEVSSRLHKPGGGRKRQSETDPLRIRTTRIGSWGGSLVSRQTAPTRKVRASNSRGSKGLGR